MLLSWYAGGKWQVEEGGENGRAGNADSKCGQHFQESLAEMDRNMRSKNLSISGISNLHPKRVFNAVQHRL